MSATDKEKIIDRIRKLMAVAKCKGASESEMNSYMDAARRMMDEHNLEEAEVLSTEANRKTAYDSIVDEEALGRAQVMTWEHHLAQAVAICCDVRSYVGPTTYRELAGRKIPRASVRFFGLPTDVSVAKVFYAEMRIATTIMAREAYGEDRVAQGEFCDGFAHRLVMRAQQGRNTSQVPGLIIKKDELLNRFGNEKLSLGKMYVGSGGDRSRSTSDAYQNGWATAGNVDMGVENRFQRGASQTLEGK